MFAPTDESVIDDRPTHLLIRVAPVHDHPALASGHKAPAWARRLYYGIRGIQDLIPAGHGMPRRYTNDRSRTTVITSLGRRWLEQEVLQERLRRLSR
jgi:hypothetical protein